MANKRLPKCILLCNLRGKRNLIDPEEGGRSHAEIILPDCGRGLECLIHAAEE
jgi:hypothetical protein